MIKLDDFLALTLEARRRTRVRPKPRGAYMCRPERTPEQLIEYLKTRNIRTVGQLRSNRKPDEPNLYDFRVFGSWRAAKEAAFGKPSPFQVSQRPSTKYIIDAVVRLNLRTRDAYQTAHKTSPWLIPSIYWIRLLFGRNPWDKVRWAVEQVDITACLEQWFKLRRRLGRWPSAEDCDRTGVSLDAFRKVYGTRAELNDFLRRIARLADEKEKAALQNFSHVQVAISGSGGGEFDSSDTVPASVSAPGKMPAVNGVS